MTDRRAQFQDALRLANRALLLLDDLGERDAALYIQRAIDEMTDAKPPCSAAEAQVFLDSAEGRRLLARLELIGVPTPTTALEPIALQ